MKLHLSAGEVDIINEQTENWIQEHKKTCAEYNLPHRGDIFESRISYTFVPTSIGNFCTVKCWCGNLLNLTSPDTA